MDLSDDHRASDAHELAEARCTCAERDGAPTDCPEHGREKRRVSTEPTLSRAAPRLPID